MVSFWSVTRGEGLEILVAKNDKGGAFEILVTKSDKEGRGFKNR